jgi:tetratricopeptide (TPR) repeat protein
VWLAVKSAIFGRESPWIVKDLLRSGWLSARVGGQREIVSGPCWRALQISTRSFGPTNVRTLVALAAVSTAMSERWEADGTCVEVAALVQKQFPLDHPLVSGSLDGVLHELWKSGAYPDVERLYGACLSAFEVSPRFSSTNLVRLLQSACGGCSCPTHCGINGCTYYEVTPALSISLYDRVLRKLDASGDTGRDVARRARRSLLRFCDEHGRDEDAERVLSRLEQDDLPLLYSKALLDHARAYVRSGNARAAESTLRRALESTLRLHDAKGVMEMLAHQALGELYLRQERLDEAAVEYEGALDRCRSSSVATNLATIYARQGKDREVARVVARAEKTVWQWDVVDVYLWNARYRLSRGRRAEAVAEIRRGADAVEKEFTRNGTVTGWSASRLTEALSRCARALRKMGDEAGARAVEARAAKLPVDPGCNLERGQ